MIEKLKSNIILLIRFFASFGIIKGIELFTKIKFGIVENLKIPNIAYPINLRFGTSDIPTFLQVFIYGGYDVRCEKPPQIIIDCGANIGLFAIFMKNRFPEAKIICIEPDIDNFNLLQKNISAYKNIYYEKYGIWNKNTKLRIYDKYNLGNWGMVVEEDELNGTVNSISINTLLEKYLIEDIDILKIDIETSEKNLFSNNFHKWLPKVKTIIIELHDGLEKGCSKPFFEAINICYDNYYFSTCGENVIIKKIEI